MPTTNYPGGQSLVSSALSPAQMQLIWQVLTLQMLGNAAYLDTATVAQGSNAVTVAGTGYAIGQEFWLPAAGFAPAIITGISGQVVTVGLNATAAATNTQCQVCAPGAFGLVQTDWPTNGQPDWTAGQDVAFLGCTTQPNEYTKVRDRSISAATSTTVTQQWNYTRSWKVAWTAYGPNALPNLTTVASGLFQSFANWYLSGFNLYPIASFDQPIRAPEIWSSQWFERADFEVTVYEGVTETSTDGAGTSVQVEIERSSGASLTESITAQ